MKYAECWRRLLADPVAVIPIVLLTAGFFYVFLGFDLTVQAYLEDRTVENRVRFLIERNRVRDLSFILWILYSVVLEASPLQGSLGKMIRGIKVVDRAGGRLTLARSAKRNVAKIIAYLPLGLGFLWAAFSKTKQAWHDSLAKTSVTLRQ